MTTSAPTGIGNEPPPNITEDNPFDDLACAQDVYFSGWLVPVHLVAVDGNELEQKWTVQEAKDKSGANAVYAGQKLVEGMVYTFEAEKRSAFATFYELFRKFKPGAPGGSATGTGGAATAAGGTADANTQASSNAGASGTVGVAVGGTGKTSADGWPSIATAAGPKAPTLSIRNLYANFIGVTNVGMKKWKGPYVTSTRSWRVDLTLIQVKPPKQITGGKAGPAQAGSQWATAGATPATPADNAANAKKGAVAATANT